MIKIILLLSFFSSHAFAQEFIGCGEYLFKGLLKMDEHSPFKMLYIVHEGTKSQMNFRLKEKDDAIKLALIIDIPSSFKASITKPMDGTSGVLSFPTEISRRFPDPLKSSSTGILKIKEMKCD